jgi:catechol 2,3-dioxygenase-like lactoylglutathione lyase family enzyme
MLLNFGQPVDGIAQTAFVVPDLRAAIDRWVADLGVGPWFVRDRLEGLNPIYRGAPATSAVTLAMGFAGNMQIELIQPLNDAPSIYKETIEARGYGFHHVGYAASDFAATLERFRALGYEEAYRAGVPTGGDVVFFDTKGALPGFVEVFEASAAVEEVFTRFYIASVGWNGEQPVRPFM